MAQSFSNKQNYIQIIVHAKLQNCNIIVILLTLVFNYATKYDASVLKCVKVGTVIPMFKVLKINNT